MLNKQDHLLFIAPTAYPLGGIAVWLDYLMTGLLTNSIAQITFGAVSGHYHDAKIYLEKYPFVNAEIIDCGTGTQVARASAVIELIEKVQPTMVVCTNIADVYFATRLLKSRQGIEYILVATIHALEPKLISDMIEYIDVIDHIVVTNKLTRAVVSEMTDYHEQQIHYAPYGVNLPAAIDKVETSVEPLRILYCGRIAKDQKRCQDLVKIVQGLTDGGVNYQLLVAGDGPYKDQLLSELDSEKIVYLGSIPAEQVSEKAYRQADILLLTSEWETGPIVIWEALAHGLAVVTSKYSGVKTEGALIDNINCLMFEVGDVHGAVTAITSLLDGSRRRMLSDAGMVLIKDRYSRELSVKQWRMVFDEIASDTCLLYTSPSPRD